MRTGVRWTAGRVRDRRGSALSDARQLQPATRLKRNEMVKKTPRSYIDVTVTCRRITGSCRRRRRSTLTFLTAAQESSLAVRAYSFLPEQIDRIFNKPPGAERCNLPALTPPVPALSWALTRRQDNGTPNCTDTKQGDIPRLPISNILECYKRLFRCFAKTSTQDANWPLCTVTCNWSEYSPQGVSLTANMYQTNLHSCLL